MSETAQQYIRRITGHVEGKDPLAVQAATARRLERLIKGVPTRTPEQFWADYDGGKLK